MKTSWYISTNINLQRVGSYSLSFHTTSRLSQHTTHPNNKIHLIYTLHQSNVADFEKLGSYVEIEFDDSTKVHNYNIDYCPSVAKL